MITWCVGETCVNGRWYKHKGYASLDESKMFCDIGMTTDQEVVSVRVKKYEQVPQAERARIVEQWERKRGEPWREVKR